MSFSIALAGKGGTGKTTIAGLLITYLLHRGNTPVLAVDADPNANLNEVLGLTVTDTLGNAREDMKKGKVPSGMTKDVFMSMRLEQAICEHDGFDLVVMGQPEGRGCYCAANTLLTNLMDRLTRNYPVIVIDNEAGMEHISRMTTHNTDLLLLVSDGSRRGLQAAVRIHELAAKINIGVTDTRLIINQVKDDSKSSMEEFARILATLGKGNPPEIGGVIAVDEMVYEYDLSGRPTVEMPPETPVMRSCTAIFDRIIPEF